jgi:hypothetical protein
MAKNYKDLWASAADLEKQGEDVANANANAAKLPYTLKDEFRKAQDPKLDEAINKAQSDTFGAAIKGLDMYKGISDPFARRDLAEQYQGGIEMGWKNLTDERTRRQGVYSDYITKWTGLYGAEAARKQDLFNNKVQTWDREKTLADTDENNRRWEIENARSAASAGSKGDDNLFWEYAQNELASSVGEDGKYDPRVYERIRSEAKRYNINKDSFDNDMSYGLGESEYKNLGIGTTLSPTQQKAKLELEEMERNKEIGRKADDNEDNYYWSGTKVKKKKTGWFGFDWLAKDETIGTVK